MNFVPGNYFFLGFVVVVVVVVVVVFVFWLLKCICSTYSFFFYIVVAIATLANMNCVLLKRAMKWLSAMIAPAQNQQLYCKRRNEH